MKDIKKAYLIGIKGVGMTALAQILQSRGANILGSDTGEKFFTDEVLQSLGISFIEGFSKNNLPEDADLVIHSQAYTAKNNPEVAEAQRRGLNVIMYPDALSELFNDAYGVAICGTHGKSTTTAMLAHILKQAGLDPTAVVGSRVNEWGSNALAGNGKHFIIEADEYKEVFLRYNPKIILLTNVDFDHPDYFKNKRDYNEAFKKFLSKNSTEKIIDGRKIAFDKIFKLKLPGAHNQFNANLAYAAALELNVSEDTARKALESFEGLARRFEIRGNYNGAKLYDDYAHHPQEIKAALAGAKEKYPNKKITVLFQPHTYSRTKALFEDFTKSFVLADEIYILKSYASARETGEDIWGRKLAKTLNTKYFKNHQTAADYVRDKLDPSFLFLTIGAGDGWQVLELLKQTKALLTNKAFIHKE